MPISERKLKKAEQEITRITNDLLKPYRGLVGVEPRVEISLHHNDGITGKIYEKIEGEYHSSSGYEWSGYEWKTIEQGKLRLTIFKP